ncbi:MAG TPA: F0F1 ATP synthase subunit B [Patescibacteria group bacterium]|nr:F0F1 ATP synthase subunit B [Patescibacteria group bacterium]
MSEATGIAALGIDWKILVAQLINFLIIYFLLNRFAFKPLVKVLEERRRKVGKSIETAKKIEEEKIALDRKVTQALAKARSEAQAMIIQTENTLKTERAKGRAETEAHTAQMVGEARAQIKEYKANTQKELAREIGLLVVKATERIVEEDIPADTKNKISDKITAQIKS